MTTKYVTMIEELDTSGTSPQRILTSEDGKTWTENPPLIMTGGGSFAGTSFPGRLGMRSDMPGVLFYPDGGPAGTASPFYPNAVVARSDDSGVTWTGVVPASLFDIPNGDFWVIHGVVGSPQGMFAYGIFRSHGVTYQLLKSNIASTVFDTPITLHSGFQNSTIRCGIRVQGGLFLFGDSGTENPQIWRTENYGNTFTPIPIPLSNYNPNNVTYRVNAICDLGNGVILAGGAGTNITPAGEEPPRLWRSTDYGLTWTELTGVITGITTGAGVRHSVADIVSPSVGVAVVAIDGKPVSPDNHRYFRMSKDAGLTFPIIGTYTPTPSSPTPAFTATPQGMAVAEDGAVLAGINLDDYTTELWRGTPTPDYNDIAWERVHSRTETEADGGCGVSGTSYLFPNEYSTLGAISIGGGITLQDVGGAWIATFPNGWRVTIRERTVARIAVREFGRTYVVKITVGSLGRLEGIEYSNEDTVTGARFKPNAVGVRG